MAKVAQTYGCLVGNPSADTWLGEFVIISTLDKVSTQPVTGSVKSIFGQEVCLNKETIYSTWNCLCCNFLEKEITVPIK